MFQRFENPWGSKYHLWNNTIPVKCFNTVTQFFKLSTVLIISSICHLWHLKTIYLLKHSYNLLKIDTDMCDTTWFSLASPSNIFMFHNYWTIRESSSQQLIYKLLNPGVIYLILVIINSQDFLLLFQVPQSDCHVIWCCGYQVRRQGMKSNKVYLLSVTCDTNMFLTLLLNW